MHRYLICTLPVVGLLLVGSNPALASGDSTGIVACKIEAWSTDKDPKGLNVRAGPGTDHPVIARIPPRRKIEGEEFAAQVSITGSKDGWFRIESAILPDYIEDDDKEVFKGVGWVSGRHLGLLLNRMTLLREPSLSAPVVAKLFKDYKGPNDLGGGPDSFVVDRLDACQDSWVEVEGTFLGARLHGWTGGTCANQVTTCP
jgi:hypothetical protein